MQVEKYANENKEQVLTKEQFEQLTNEYAELYKIAHTPSIRVPEPGRNDICPYCDSGKKFKNCSCYNKYHKQYTKKL